MLISKINLKNLKSYYFNLFLNKTNLLKQSQNLTTKDSCRYMLHFMPLAKVKCMNLSFVMDHWT